MEREKTNLNARIYRKKDEYLIFLENKLGETVDIIAVEEIKFVNIEDFENLMLEESAEAYIGR